MRLDWDMMKSILEVQLGQEGPLAILTNGLDHTFEEFIGDRGLGIGNACID